MTLQKAVETLSSRYSSHVLGLIMFLVLWFYVVDPQLERQRLDFGALQKVVEELKDIQRAQAEIAATMHQSVKVLERIAARNG